MAYLVYFSELLGIGIFFSLSILLIINIISLIKNVDTYCDEKIKISSKSFIKQLFLFIFSLCMSVFLWKISENPSSNECKINKLTNGKLLLESELLNKHGE